MYLNAFYALIYLVLLQTSAVPSTVSSIAFSSSSHGSLSEQSIKSCEEGEFDMCVYEWTAVQLRSALEQVFPQHMAC